jgi:hypothetical protein
VQWVVKIRLATQAHPGYPGYAVFATKARDECVSTLGITLYKSNDRYHRHQVNDIAHPNKKFKVLGAARNFRAKRKRLKIPSAAEGGLTLESAKLQAAKRQ